MPGDVNIAVQLFSVRDHLGPELGETCKRLAEIGYTHIEPYDIIGDTPALHRAMRDSGLVAAAAHANVLSENRDRMIEAAGQLGIGTLIVPWVEAARYDDRESIERLAGDINAAARVAADHGIRVGYHNHEFEFNHRVDGRPGYEVLVDLLDEDIVLQLDCFWASVGGTDPLDLLPRLGDRVRYLHVAYSPVPDPTKPPLLGGDGTLHLPEIIRGSAGHVEMCVVEVVTDGDIFEALRENHGYFHGVLAA
ncbi:MAG TPA: sugar phosphate isomerase/epimerase [Rugosimonospora sp.]|jgi:sugar phosphate isomerase/epimerase